MPSLQHLGARSPARSIARALAITSLLAVAAIAHPAEATPAQAPQVIPVPAEIDATGGQDVTAALNAFLATVPPGSVVEFPPGGRFRIEDTVQLVGTRDVTIEGRGSELFATTEGYRERAAFRLTSVVNVVVRDLIVTGANAAAGVDGPFRVELEAQHGYNLQGVDGVLLERVTARNVYGDLLYITSQQRTPSRNVVVRGSTFSGSGRQGMAITAAEDVTFAGNSLTNACRSLIDFEPFNAADPLRRIAIVDNDLGPQRFFMLAAAGAASPMEHITIARNRVHGSPPRILMDGHSEQRRGPITIADNVSDLGWNDTIFGFVQVDGITITGNAVPLAAQKDGVVVSAVSAEDSTCVSVSGNNFGEANPTDAHTQAIPACGSVVYAELPRSVAAAGAGAAGGDPGGSTPDTAPPVAAPPAAPAPAGEAAPVPAPVPEGGEVPPVAAAPVLPPPADQALPVQPAIGIGDKAVPDVRNAALIALAALLVLWPAVIRQARRRRESPPVVVDLELW